MAANDGPTITADDAERQGPTQEKAQPTVTSPQDKNKAIDLNALAKARDALDQQLKFWKQAMDDTSRSWGEFDEQVAGTSSELVRLRDLEPELARVSALFDEEKRRADTFRTELAEVMAREAEANDRAEKLEEVCEQIKERAVEIHTALQTSRTSEQKLQAELNTFRSRVIELGRNVQDEEAGRIAAEERNTKLQAAIADLEKNESDARARIVKVTEEKVALENQVPQLVADSNSWQKQFSASERENARLQSERRVSAERIADLEAEIKVLREDLASLVGGRAEARAPVAAAAVAAVATVIEQTPALDARPEHVVEEAKSDNIDADNPEELVEIDDLDLVSTLDRAFSFDAEQDLEDESDKRSK